MCLYYPLRLLSTKYVLLVSALAAVVVATLFLGPWIRPAPQQFTQAQPEVRMSYSWRYSDTILENIHPSGGKMFLIVSLTILNRGYANFTAEPFSHIFVIIGSASYNASAVSFFVQGPFPAELRNGGSAGPGDVVFEVPQSTTGPPTPGWRLSPGSTIRITWVAA